MPGGGTRDRATGGRPAIDHIFDGLVPVAGINHHQKSNSFPGGARNSGVARRPSLHAVLLALGVWAFLIGVGLASISVHGMGGGSVAWGNRESVRLMQRAIDAGEPIRLERGHYTSAGVNSSA